MGFVFEFPAVSQSRVEWWGSPQYTRKGMLIFTVLLGFLGLHHFYLRSPQTGFLFIFFNILSLGYWYFFDIIQLATNDVDTLNKYGLDIPMWGAAGIAQGMWKCKAQAQAEGEQKGGGSEFTEAPNPIWFLLYAILLPILPLSRMLVGDTYNSLIAVLNLTVIPFGWIMNILSGAYDYINMILFPGDLFYNGIKRPFPFTVLGWSKDGFSKRITGREKSAAECEDDSVFVRVFKGLLRSFLPIMERFLPAELTMALRSAIAVKEQVVDKAIATVETGVKVGTQVAQLATEVPVAFGSGLAGAQQAVLNEAMKGASSRVNAGLMRGGGKVDDSFGGMDILALGGLGALIGGALLLNVGRSFADAVQSYRGPTDIPPPASL